MEIIEFEYPQVPSCPEKIILCLGYFDGIHLGHQKLIKDAINYSNGVYETDTEDPNELIILG